MQEQSYGDVLPGLHINPNSKRDLTERRRNGVFYTPLRVTEILSKWAIRKRDDLILEPSFGGCGFLVSAKDRLEELHNEFPEKNLFGCDIDDMAFDILEKLFGEPDLDLHFKKQDFLTVSSDQFPPVDVVIGNPPYISWHNMAMKQRAVAISIATDFHVSKSASLWMYFILHSLSFIKPGGRMAWILPGSFIFSDYSAVLREVLSKYFERNLAVFLEERIFLELGTEESSVILLCDGYQKKPTEDLQFVSVKGLDNLEKTITYWNERVQVGSQLPRRPQLAMVPLSLLQSFSRISQERSVHKLGQLANIKIGLVTGANKFFILKQDEVRSNKISESFIEPILAKFSQSRGLCLTKDDLELSRIENQKCLMINTRKFQQLPETLNDYLNSFPLAEREKNYTFKKTRPIWHQIDDGVRPDGFFSSMQSDGPTLVLNSACTTCTNTIYQVSFLFNVSDEIKKVIAISVQSSFSQFSAEVEGRTHSGGALKLEPSEVKRLALIIPEDCKEVDLVFEEIDKNLRRGDRLSARNLSDKFLLDCKAITEKDLSDCKEGLQILRRIRSGHRK